MGNENQCGLCTYVRVKNKFFGGKKYTCSLHNREVSETAVCPKFKGDRDRILKRVRFRPHEYGSPNGCNNCAYRKGNHEKAKTIYSCNRNNVQFWPDFDPMNYICDNFKDGGIDALIGFMADLIVEENKYRKGDE